MMSHRTEHRPTGLILEQLADVYVTTGAIHVMIVLVAMGSTRASSQARVRCMRTALMKRTFVHWTHFAVRVCVHAQIDV